MATEHIDAATLVRHAEYHGVHFVGGYQFWSNPALYQSRQAIQIVLLRPTLLDMISIVEEFGAEDVERTNGELLASGLIARKRFDENAERIVAVKDGMHARSVSHQ